jgi:hypothetical protein
MRRRSAAYNRLIAAAITATLAGVAMTTAGAATAAGTALPSQTITFGSLPATADIGGTYDSDQVTSTSGLVVTVSIDPSSAGGACKLMGSTVTFTGGGNCVLDASQAGDSSWAPATAQASVAVNVPPQIFTNTTTSSSTSTTPVTQTTPSNQSSMTNAMNQSDVDSAAGAIFRGKAQQLANLLGKSTNKRWFTLSFSENSGGAFSEVIYGTLHKAGAKRAEQVVVAEGTSTLKKPGKGSVELKLTPQGKQLVEQATKAAQALALSTNVTFSPRTKGLNTVHATDSKSIKL